MRNRDLIKVVLVSSVLSAALVIVFLSWPSPPPAKAEFQPASAPAQKAPLTEDERINIQVYEQLSKSVVNVTSIRLELNFWLDVIPRSGVGSGFFVDGVGHLVTNDHVIEDARSLQVTLYDGSKVEAEVTGRDPLTDLAVLKVDCANGDCPPITFASHPDLKVGQKVLAIGNPFGLERTLTTGIISSLSRSLETRTGVLDDLVQTDAAINPGNSGGPLLNSRGELIGVNTAILSGTGENVGIGFAIPVATVYRVVSDLVNHGRVLRPWFGIRGRSLDSRLAKALDAPVDKGVLVERVADGSSADRAGIRGGSRRVFYGNVPIIIGGDILVSLAGKEVTQPNDTIRFLEGMRPGDEVEVAYYQEGRLIRKKIQLVGEEGERRRFRF